MQKASIIATPFVPTPLQALFHGMLSVPHFQRKSLSNFLKQVDLVLEHCYVRLKTQYSSNLTVHWNHQGRFMMGRAYSHTDFQTHPQKTE